jgi:hypothetical protein
LIDLAGYGGDGDYVLHMAEAEPPYDAHQQLVARFIASKFGQDSY